MFCCFVFGRQMCTTCVLYEYLSAQVYNAYQTLLKGLASMLQTFHGIAKGSAVEGCSQLPDSGSSVLPKQQTTVPLATGSSSGRSSVERENDGSTAAGGDPSVNHILFAPHTSLFSDYWFFILVFGLPLCAVCSRLLGECYTVSGHMSSF